MQKALSIVKVKGTENAADLGTKHVETKILQRCCAELGLAENPLVGGEANVVAALFAGAMTVPQPNRFRVLRLLMTAATLASVKAQEDPPNTCMKEVAIGATVTRTAPGTGVLFSLRIDGIYILFLTVILTMALTMCCCAGWQRSRSTSAFGDGHRTRPNNEKDTTDAKVQAIRFLTGRESRKRFYVSPSGHCIHLSLDCKSELNPSTVRTLRFCQLCMSGA